MNIVAYTKYGREAASTRQRLLQYLPAFDDAGIRVEWHPLLGDDYVRSLADGSSASKAAIARSYARRFRQLLRRSEADLVWVYAELFPYLPGEFERLAFRSGVPVVYDCDDAFFVPYDENPRAFVRRILGGKLQPLITGAAACTCGNAYLEDYARQFCERTLVVPTVVDTELYRPANPRLEGPLTIGWIGSPTTWPQVQPLLPMLREVCQASGARFRVIGAGHQAREDRFEGLDLIDWSEDREVAEVQAMDVGIMPLVDAPWQRGKSGYKLVQYMACGLPVVASPVGVNSAIVSSGGNGFLARAEQEWRDALLNLIGNGDLRRRFGEAGRARAVESYSLTSQAPRLIELFRSLAPKAG